MRLRFYGVRGLLPSPGPATSQIGGNTSCVAVFLNDPRRVLIFDAGTGIARLGGELAATSLSYDIHLFLSHFHWDHIIGLPYFLPAFQPRHKLTIHAPKAASPGVEETLRLLISSSFQPFHVGTEFRAYSRFREVEEGQYFADDISVSAFLLNHPVPCLGYRLRLGQFTVTYATDHEPYFDILSQGDPATLRRVEALNRKYREFISGSDLLIADGQYLPDEYKTHKGWGQGVLHELVNQAVAAGVKRLVFTHHDPQRKDDHVVSIQQHYEKLMARKNIPLAITAAREGWEFTF